MMSVSRRGGCAPRVALFDDIGARLAERDLRGRDKVEVRELSESRLGLNETRCPWVMKWHPFPVPRQAGFSLGPFEVHAYGLMYVVAVAVAMLMTVRRWEAQGGSRETV